VLGEPVERSVSSGLRRIAPDEGVFLVSLRSALTGAGGRVTVRERARAQLVRSRSSTRRTGSEREPDAPSSAGQPLQCRHSPGDVPGNRDGGAAWRIAAHRSGRLGRHPLHAGPEGRRGTARARWSTTRPDDQRPHGRRSRRAVTPLDAATEDGSFPLYRRRDRPRNPPSQVQRRRPELRSPWRRAPNHVFPEGSSVMVGPAAPLAAAAPTRDREAGAVARTHGRDP
jgi:hypothetical protein